MKRATIRLLHTRYCTEYCHLPQEASSIPFEIDHIIAQKHRGQTEPANLALSCFYCNSAKGANIAGRDPETGQLTRLYHPRVDAWHEHFSWSAETLVATWGERRLKCYGSIMRKAGCYDAHSSRKISFRLGV